MDSSSIGIEGLFRAAVMRSMASCRTYLLAAAKNTHRAVFVARLHVSWWGGCSSYELERERHDAQI